MSTEEKGLFKNLFEKYNLIVFIYALIGSILVFIASITYLGFIIATSIGLFFLVVSFIIFRNKLFIKRRGILYYLVITIIAVFLTNGAASFIKVFNIDDTKGTYIFLWLSLFLTLSYFLGIISRILLMILSKAKCRKVQMIMGVIVALSLFSMLFIYIPGEIMLSNPKDYLISFNEFIKPEIIIMLFFAILILALVTLMKEPIAIGVIDFLAGILLAMYAQNYFMNSNTGILNGFIYDWKQDVAGAIINMFIWLILILLPFIIRLFLKKYHNSIVMFLCSALFVMQGASLIVHLINADKEAFVMKNYYFDNSGQYKVAKGDNVILFVLDAVDNDYMDELLDYNDAIFDEYKDFMLFTNTCSVFDETFNSMPQMLSGSSYDSTPVDYNEFYKRLHDEGYVVNAYSYECGTSFNDVKEYLDNCKYADADDSTYEVEYGAIAYNNTMLSLYQTLPNVLKSTINIKNIDFSNAVNYPGQGNDAYYENEEFASHLILDIDDDFENAFIIEHIDGAHAPKDDYVATTKYLLEIISEYCRQLKELGLYDDSVIIITSDHGLHDDFPDMFQTAATPILLIKTKGNRGDGIVINDAPVYHTDFLKTILECENLYRAEDGERFGYSFFDFKSGDSRTRSWYNREYQTYYGYYYEYTYDGDDKILKDKVNNGDYKKVY